MNIKFKGATFFYTCQGNGKTIVLLHGFLENQTMWESFIPLLSKNHTVITIDLPGHGKSDCLGYIHSMELMAEVVEAVLTQEKIAQVTFIGHSMGGYVALAFAERLPKMCAKMVLLNSTPKEDSPDRKQNRDRAIALVKKHKEAFLSMAISNLFAENNKTPFASEIAQLKKEAFAMQTQGIIAALEGMKIRKDRTAVLKNLSVQKIIISGKNDPIIAVNELEIIAQNCHCDFLSFEGGHMSTIENKEEILKFMQTL